MLKDDVAWRREEEVVQLADQHADTFLGRPVDGLWQWLPSWHQGVGVWSWGLRGLGVMGRE